MQFEKRHFNNARGQEYNRLFTQLPNGLGVLLPVAIQNAGEMGEYEKLTLAALQTPEGLNFVLNALTNKPEYEVNLKIAPNWFTTAAVYEEEGLIIFSLYWGAN